MGVAAGVLGLLISISVLTTTASESAVTEPISNQLAGHPSAYLAMHADDPVHWQVWSRETLELARELNRPLLISIGYFSCHWCHVMQRESFQDLALANLLNDHFVPVKVDRELAPALDAHLIDFIQMTRGHSGWPLNVFLTPEGYPLFGMVYVPPERFRQVLLHLGDRWAEDPSRLQQMGRDAMEEWRQIRRPSAGRRAVKLSAVGNMLAQVDQLKDELAGGFGEQNKFPMVPQLQALLWVRAQRDNRAQDDFIRLTLDRMSNQGLHDELAGGFFRYVTDPNWQIPHYEKMLYDNAQLAVLYLQAAEQLRSPYYLDIGLATLDFMLRDMRHAEGYFISSFSAVDEQGREGFYYLWDEAELEKLLNDEQLKAVRAAWFGEQTAESEYGRLPIWQGTAAEIAAGLDWSTTQLNKILESARERLRRARAERALLADEKGLAAWNGLALSALAAGWEATGEPRYRESADKLAAYISGHLWEDGQLVRARQGEIAIAEATVEDYALVARGLWDWSAQDPPGKRLYIGLVKDMVRRAWHEYYRDGRWHRSDTALIPMLDGVVALSDSSLPSSTAILTRLSRDHPNLKNDALLQEKVQAHLDEVRTYLGDSMFQYSSYVSLLETE